MPTSSRIVGNDVWESLAQVTGLDFLSEKSAPSRQLCDDVLELSTLFTRKRDSLGAAYLDHERLHRAYLSYFLPVNLAKVQSLLGEMPKPAVGLMGSAASYRVLDLASGPGTGALAVLDWWRNQRQHNDQTWTLELFAVDRSSVSLETTQKLWSAYRAASSLPHVHLQTCIYDLEREKGAGLSDRFASQLGTEPFDLIMIHNGLNELFLGDPDPVSRRIELLLALLQRLSPHGTMMIVEPALRTVARELHHIRDALLAVEACTVYAPCLHHQSCGALVKPDDWCHEERPWVAPPFIEQIDRQIGLIKDALKFSYLLLRKDEQTVVSRAPNVYRVVSERRDLKGEARVWVCNELGRGELGRLDREQSLFNEEFSLVGRGDIIAVNEIRRKTKNGQVSPIGRIPSDAQVDLVRRPA